MMRILETLTAAGVSPAAILLIGVLVAVFLLLVIVTRGRVLRLFTVFFRRSRFIRATHSAGARARSYVGSSGFAAFRRMFHPLTETEKALVEVNAMSGATRQALDYAMEEYARQPEHKQDLNINAAMPAFQTKERELWREYRNGILAAERRKIFDRHKSRIRKQIGNPDAEFEDVDFDSIDYEKIGEYVDESDIAAIIHANENIFGAQEEKLSRDGIYFRELSARPGFVNLSEQFELPQAQRNYLLASRFFRYDIPVQSDENLLYEDINDAMIVRIMGGADSNIFYFLTEMRKMANRNVRLLSVLIAVFLGLFIAANYWFPTVMDMVQAAGRHAPELAAASAAEPVGFFKLLAARFTDPAFTEDLANRSLFALASFVLALALVGFFYRNPYTHFQSQNRVHLINLMTSYSADLVSKYKKAESQSRGSFSGDQSGPAAREHSKIWFMNMQWIAFRLFCVELFLRSVIFQIKRNSGYYILGMPLMVLLPVLIFLCWLPEALFFRSGEAPAGFNAATIALAEYVALNAAFVILLFILAWNICWKGCLMKCVERFLDIEDAAWQNFHNLDLQFTSAGLVRHFVSEIYNERMRVRGGGGGGAGF